MPVVAPSRRRSTPARSPTGAIQITVRRLHRGFPTERFYRDAKLNEIHEGTSEVLRNTIAHELRR
ncbi:MAG: acyl-CoA dehydrogenase family protein [Halobacteriales archaeon]|nr:acyl-CoA dehydrogenase family protein [Halobacteriales archaeon]